MNSQPNRRDFLRTTAAVGAGLALGDALLAAPEKKRAVLVFTKSSGFEHDVVKLVGGAPNSSIMDKAILEMGKKDGYEVVCSKDGRIFDSAEISNFGTFAFFTTGNLTEPGNDKQPPMSVAAKQKFLDAIHGGIGFVGIHAASDTFHTEPDSPEKGTRYVAYGEKSDPFLRMLGGEFITHGSTPRLQTCKVTINDPKFPGLEGVNSPVEFTEEWYSLKDFQTDIHVIGTLDTAGMKGNAYQRKPYPVIWSRMHGKGRVFYNAMGDRPENWQIPFFLNSVAGGILFALGVKKGSVTPNLTTAAPGYAEIPPRDPAKS